MFLCDIYTLLTLQIVRTTLSKAVRLNIYEFFWVESMGVAGVISFQKSLTKKLTSVPVVMLLMIS